MYTFNITYSNVLNRTTHVRRVSALLWFVGWELTDRTTLGCIRILHKPDWRTDLDLKE